MMRPPVGEWTPDVIQRLRTLWAEGHSTAKIGNRLGFSKNAIVGKAHRLKLPGRPSPIQRGRGIPRQPKVRRPVAPPAFTITTISPTPPASERVFERAKAVTPACPCGQRSCCWPIGEPGRAGFRFCEGPVESARPYCTAHSEVAYVKKTSRRRDLDAPRLDRDGDGDGTCSP